MPLLHSIVITMVFGLCMAVHAQGQQAPMLIAEGDSLLDANAPDKAMVKFNAALALKPSADGYAGRAQGALVLGQYDLYLQDVQRALGLDSLHARANCQRAWYALRVDDYRGALHFADRAVANAGTADLRRRALVIRGEARADLGMNSTAIEDLTAGLVHCSAADAEALKTLARLHDAANNPAASLAVLETLCNLVPSDIGNWANKGYELNRLERYEEALAALDQALLLDKDEPVVLSNKAYALLKLGHDAEAFSAVNRSLKADKLNPHALRTRALLYLRKGDRNKACTDLGLAKAMGGAPEVDAMVKQHCAGL